MNDIEKFDEFLSSFTDYYLPVSEISMPCAYHDKDCPSIKQKECTSKSKVPLVDSDFMMYSFDDIIRHVKTIDICNLPSTVDGLYLDKKRKILYFIEFKGVQIDKSSKRAELQQLLYNLNKDNKCYEKYYERLKRVYNMYADEVSYKLRLKPFETLDLALPNVYEDYCNENGVTDRLDIRDFLSSVRKVYIVVAICDKRNPTADRAGSYRFLLRKPFDRLRDLGLFEMVEIMDHNEFKFFLERI
ncbi:hypothetical protein [Methanobrevibacter sp.]|uniref:hypothetical protein n=1 Tax=Methanobrevibacter sp. TaxID=66852 RepID=UPI0025DD37B7|nr:hypothetical protein [Methanobrevibacter sp.]MBQ2962196.1 hypothetical protein [Methanobrevibacter sp.]